MKITVNTILFIFLVTNAHVSCSHSLKENSLLETKSQLRNTQVKDINTPTKSTSNELEILKTASVTSCNISNCQSKFGTCTSSNVCKCNDGFINVPWTDKTTSCDYSQKKQITGFMLELFIMGAGHLYRGSIILGVLKLISVVIFPYLLLCFNFAGILAEASVKTQTCFLYTTVVLFTMYLLGALVWYLYDVIIFGMNQYTDGNGYPMQAW